MEKYYYVTTENQQIIQKTQNLEELILILYQNQGKLLNQIQVKELNLPNDYLSELKKKISQYEERIPLYDVFSNHIFLVYHQNIYERIFYNSYRFIDENYIKSLKKNPDPTPADLQNLQIMENYHIPTLTKTYLKLFYQSFVLNSYITNCKKPSFHPLLEHISPYYRTNELYFLAYDWNIISKPSISEKEIRSICKKITKYDISSKNLLDHQLYIYKCKAFGLVKHYSLFGSYYMNQYLRKTNCLLNEKVNCQTIVRNIPLENQIKIMGNIIKNAPPLSKSHTVYRFIEEDFFIQHLNIGDTYIDNSFISTTRNPFYFKENNPFGTIMIKIKLPENVKGVGLFIESYSNFPHEEEIILLPGTKLKLISILDSDSIVQLYNNYHLQIKKKYHFEWIGNISLDRPTFEISIPGAIEKEIPLVNLSKIYQTFSDDTMADRIKTFQNNYCDTNNHFKSVIGNIIYTFSINSYNSTGIYRPFFYYEISNGIMVTTYNPKYGNINIIFELSPEAIHVNYYFKYSVTDPSSVVNLDSHLWIEWMSLFAYILGSRSVVIHSNYTLGDTSGDSLEMVQMKSKYAFSYNAYIYLKKKIRMYSYIEVSENFDYYQFDSLFEQPVDEVIKSYDHDELYRIYQSVDMKNIGDFYLFIVEKYPKLINSLESKLDLLFGEERNPFRNISYTIDCLMYLYNKDLIPHPPSNLKSIKKGSFQNLIGDKKISKFKNRLRNIIQND